MDSSRCVLCRVATDAGLYVFGNQSKRRVCVEAGEPGYTVLEALVPAEEPTTLDNTESGLEREAPFEHQQWFCYRWRVYEC